MKVLLFNGSPERANGCTYLALAEIAEIQQVPEGTVKTRLFHGRRNLRDCVQAHGEGESS